MDYLDPIARTPTEPRFQTLEAAQAAFPGLSLDAYTLARIINSEYDHGTPIELVSLGDADRTKAEALGKSIYQHATNGSGYGAQGDRSGSGGDRPVSTARSPGPRHVLAALTALGPARGIARGAQRYFDAAAMEALHRDYKSGVSTKVVSCSALGVLTAWTYGRPQCGGNRCCANGLPLPGPNGTGQEEWIGPTPGINAYKLMLMRPATAEQGKNYAEAVKVIQSAGAYQGTGSVWTPPSLPAEQAPSAEQAPVIESNSAVGPIIGAALFLVFAAGTAIWIGKRTKSRSAHA